MTKDKNDQTTSNFCFLFIFFFLLSVPSTFAQNQNAASDNNNNYNTQFSPSLAIIVVILVAALFLMGFFSIYIRHCADSPSGTVLPTTGGGRSRRGARGLDPAVIETFPILEYSEVKIHKIGKEVLECAVCLCEFEDTETLRLIPKCDHVFHPECIDEWLASHTTCPVCRANLVPQPGESVHAVPLVPTTDVEAQNDAVVDTAVPEVRVNVADAEGGVAASSEPEVIAIPKSLTLNRNRTTRGSNRRRQFPRSHSTGHSLVQPGENTDRFTLRLPVAVRREIINRELQRSNSLLVLPRDGSSRQGSSRGRTLRRLDRSFKSDRWVLTMAPPFLVRGSSVRSPKVVDSTGGAGASSSTAPILPPSAVDSARPPV
ncbi:hypothetical protein HN51_014651 [Arachis hypogaea]|uniref:RING-type E3 ubiquitin transferase n=1 Tax=Arachis duranensis TaxID=130453 RepID=A0A6P4DKY7_ARADU|nr:E3 ubiquitin-protein ligase ATL6 [Arachis duranensis]